MQNPRGRGSASRPLASPSVPPPPCSPLVTRHSPLTPVQSTLPRHHGSVSRQMTLTPLESALTGLVTPHLKQRTLSPAESTLPRFLAVSPLESALPKRGGGGGPAIRFVFARSRSHSPLATFLSIRVWRMASLWRSRRIGGFRRAVCRGRRGAVRGGVDRPETALGRGLLRRCGRRLGLAGSGRRQGRG
jgi:hypothetical protein